MKKKFVSYIAVIATLLCITTVVAVWIKDDEVAGNIPAIEASTVIDIIVNGSALRIDILNENSVMETEWLTTEFMNQFYIGNFSGYEMTVNGLPVAPNTTMDIPIKKISKMETIDIGLTNKNSKYESHYYIRTLPMDAPEFITRGESTTGKYYFTVSNFMFKLSQTGEITYYKKAPQRVMDFKPTTVDDRTYYSYLLNSPSPENPLSPDFYTSMGPAIIMDEYFQIVDGVPSMIAGERLPEHYPLESHDFLILGEQHYLMVTYFGERVNNFPTSVSHSDFGARVVTTVLQEINHGKLVWEWYSSDHPELYEMSVEGNDYFNYKKEWSDYAHLNSVVIDPADGNPICSFRNLDAILKIDKASGEIKWVLGGKMDQFGLTDEQKFSRQHYARFTKEGALTIFDNGTNTVVNGYPEKYEGTGKGISRAIEIRLDENAKRVVDFKSYSLDGHYSSIMGSAQKLESDNETFLIGWGGRNTSNALFSEIDFTTNEVLFEVMLPLRSFGDSTYRAYKSEK